MVIVEYCEYGNVQNILRIHRRQFIDQIDREEDSIDTSIINSSTQNGESAESVHQIAVADDVGAQGNTTVPNNYTSVNRGNANKFVK